MGGIEIVAAVLGVINVLLVVRRSSWNYPFGIVMVALYFFVFWNAKLYSDALLQIRRRRVVQGLHGRPNGAVPSGSPGPCRPC